MRVVVTRIEQDGTMQRRVVDTARQDDARRWEELATRALACVPPYQPIPGTAVYHIGVDGRTVQVGEYDLDGALRDLVTLVLAMGEGLAQLARPRAGQEDAATAGRPHQPRRHLPHHRSRAQRARPAGESGGHAAAARQGSKHGRPPKSTRQ